MSRSDWWELRLVYRQRLEAASAKDVEACVVEWTVRPVITLVDAIALGELKRVTGNFNHG